MNIEYNIPAHSETYGSIIYNVSVVFNDDGIHFSYFSYRSYLLLKGDDVDKSDDELYDMVIEDLKKNYKKYNRITFEEQLDDPAFECINISIVKEIFYDKSIKITK